MDKGFIVECFKKKMFCMGWVFYKCWIIYKYRLWICERMIKFYVVFIECLYFYVNIWDMDYVFVENELVVFVLVYFII